MRPLHLLVLLAALADCKRSGEPAMAIESITDVRPPNLVSGSPAPADDTPLVIVRANAISVGSGVVAQVASLVPNAPIIEELNAALGPHIAASKKGGSADVRVLADSEVPYRVLAPVVQTVAHAGATRVALIGAHLPKAVALYPELSPASNAVEVIILSVGYVVRVPAGRVAEGCTTTGVGVTVPKREGAYDALGIRGCLRKLKAASSEPKLVGDTVVISAAPEIPASMLFWTIDAMLADKPHAPDAPSVTKIALGRVL